MIFFINSNNYNFWHKGSCANNLIETGTDYDINVDLRFCFLLHACKLIGLFTQVTRSIGDDDLKPAVTAEPEITENTLCAEDEFMVRSFMLTQHKVTVLCIKFVICIGSLDKLSFQVS